MKETKMERNRMYVEAIERKGKSGRVDESEEEVKL